MKLLNALLATAVLLSACQAEQDGELANKRQQVRLQSNDN